MVKEHFIANGKINMPVFINNIYEHLADRAAFTNNPWILMTSKLDQYQQQVRINTRRAIFHSMMEASLHTPNTEL